MVGGGSVAPRAARAIFDDSRLAFRGYDASFPRIHGPLSAAVETGFEIMTETSKKETIVLDARIFSVIDNNAFGAELRNGHRFAAFFASGDKRFSGLFPGALVEVEMSPYDMSKGRLATLKEQGDESKSFGKTYV